MKETLEDCPLGLEFYHNKSTYDCHSGLPSDVTCKIENLTVLITRQGTVWIGINTVANWTASVFFWHWNCFKDYFDSELKTIELHIPDTQCRGNCSGILCGGC